MKKSIFLILFLVNPTFGCEQGTKLLWSYDQTNKVINLLKLKDTKVCNDSKEHLNSNINFIFKKNKKTVYSKKVFWENFVRNEFINDQKSLSSSPEKKTVIKIMNIPISKKEFSSFEVISMAEDKILGKGRIK